tara:strand:+ start:397 stop:1050 length:654 start_codon:yes stop_codon:yes gene_type:complete
MEQKLKKYKIYSIRSHNDKNMIYYDFTMQQLHKRLSAIKSRYNRYLNNTDNYLVVFELFKLGSVYIELEEELECINKEHINSILNKYIRDNDCINKNFYDIKKEQLIKEENKTDIKKINKEQPKKEELIKEENKTDIKEINKEEPKIEELIKDNVNKLNSDVNNNDDNDDDNNSNSSLVSSAYSSVSQYMSNYIKNNHKTIKKKSNNIKSKTMKIQI